MFTPKHCISTAPYRDRDRHRTQWKSALVSVSVQFVHLHTILHKPVLIIFSVRQCENTRRRIEISTPATNISCWQWWWFHGEGYCLLPPANEVWGKAMFYSSVSFCSQERGCLGGCLQGDCLQGHLPRCRGESASRGGLHWGSASGGRGWGDPPQIHGIRSTSGQYTSYWNAFLLLLTCLIAHIDRTCWCWPSR